MRTPVIKKEGPGPMSFGFGANCHQLSSTNELYIPEYDGPQSAP